MANLGKSANEVSTSFDLTITNSEDAASERDWLSFVSLCPHYHHWLLKVLKSNHENIISGVDTFRSKAKLYSIQRLFYRVLPNRQPPTSVRKLAERKTPCAYFWAGSHRLQNTISMGEQQWIKIQVCRIIIFSLSFSFLSFHSSENINENIHPPGQESYKCTWIKIQEESRNLQQFIHPKMSCNCTKVKQCARLLRRVQQCHWLFRRLEASQTGRPASTFFWIPPGARFGEADWRHKVLCFVPVSGQL